MIKELKERRINLKHKDKFGWYMRYRSPIKQDNSHHTLIQQEQNRNDHSKSLAENKRVNINPLLFDTLSNKRKRCREEISEITEHIEVQN